MMLLARRSCLEITFNSLQCVLPIIVNQFIAMGFQKRSEARARQLTLDRAYEKKMKEESEIKKKAMEDKKEIGAGTFLVLFC
jgi:hypothetical protein